MSTQVAASRARIAAAGKAWHKVLGLDSKCFLDEVKKAYRSLALWHHPDKAEGDAETFRLVQEAYVIGTRKCRKRPCVSEAVEPSNSSGNIASESADSSRAQEACREDVKAKAKAKSKGKAKSRNVQRPESRVDCDQERPAKKARTKSWLTSTSAPPAKIRKAVDEWESCERPDEKTLPDTIKSVSAEEFGAWLRAGECLPVDVREIGVNEKLQVQGAVHLSFSKAFFEPEEVAPVVARIQEDGRRWVFFSDKGGRFGTCGMVGSMLLDVFGLEAQRMHRLEGGFEAWDQCLAAKQDLARAVEPLAMRLQRRKAAMAAAAAAASEENAGAVASVMPGMDAAAGGS